MRPEEVPTGPLLVDTDVATWLLANVEEATSWKPLLRGHLLSLSFANVGELLALPISRGWAKRRKQDWTEAIPSTFVVLPFSISVTEQWAPLHIKYRGHMHKGGTNDLWSPRRPCPSILDSYLQPTISAISGRWRRTIRSASSTRSCHRLRRSRSSRGLPDN